MARRRAVNVVNVVNAVYPQDAVNRFAQVRKDDFTSHYIHDIRDIDGIHRIP
jgi:hypothetical protein